MMLQMPCYKSNLPDVSTPELRHARTKAETVFFFFGARHFWANCKNKQRRWIKESCITDAEEKAGISRKLEWYSTCKVEDGRLDYSRSKSTARIKTLGWKNRLECQLFAETQLNTPDSTSSPTRYISLLLGMLHVKVLCNASVTQTTPSLQKLPFHPTLSFSVLTHIRPSPLLSLGGCSEQNGDKNPSLPQIISPYSLSHPSLRKRLQLVLRHLVTFSFSTAPAFPSLAF